jgi:hypothetical protein
MNKRKLLFAALCTSIKISSDAPFIRSALCLHTPSLL